MLVARQERELRDRFSLPAGRGLSSRGDTVGVDAVGWLSEYSEPAIRSALRAAGAGLDQLPIELTGTNDLGRPMWASGSATVDARFLAKFAFSAPTAVRVWHEAPVLKLLGEQPAFDVPELVVASPDPACLATRIVEGGVPLSYELMRASIPERVGALGAELARFLANLHGPQILALARERLDEPLRIPEPGLQATTDELRLRFIPMIHRRQRARVRRWCDWVDEQLAAPATFVFVHGDFHAYNQLWNAKELRLLLVADFEASGIAEPEYDFRAIPSFGPGVDLLASTIDEYAVLTGRQLSLERIMALHLRTSLGDALWRTEAGLPLLLPRPGGGTPDQSLRRRARRPFRAARYREVKSRRTALAAACADTNTGPHIVDVTTPPYRQKEKRPPRSARTSCICRTARRCASKVDEPGERNARDPIVRARKVRAARR
jgi:aminoglycoside phosphotransferase (APT) family kinase protein